MSVVEHDGLKWSVPPNTDYFLGPSDHEGPLLAVFEREWAKLGGRTFLDVGAHVGRYAVRAAAKGVKTIAVEPNPETVAALTENIRLNALSEQITVLPSAAWSKTATLSLIPSTVNPTAPSTWRTVEGHQGVTHVNAVALDDVLFDHDIGFVKIDTEGAEGEILVGMAEILRRHRPALLIELHAIYYGPAIREHVLGFLSDAGYSAEVVYNQGDDYLLAHPVDASLPAAGTRWDELTCIITAWNYGTFIGEAIESVLRQDVQPAALIVIDDASTDNTSEVVAKYYPRVQYIRRYGRGGVHAAWNDGFTAAKTPWVLVLDADDRLGAHFIRAHHDVIQSDHDRVGHAAARAICLWPDGRLEGSWRDRHGAGVFSKAAWEAVGGFEHEHAPEVGFQDRLAAKGFRSLSVPGCLLEYRQHLLGQMSHGTDAARDRNWNGGPVSGVRVNNILLDQMELRVAV